MSDAQALTAERRLILMARIDRGQQIFGGAKMLLQGYEATVRQLEELLAGMLAERDAYKAFVGEFLRGRDLDSAIWSYSDTPLAGYARCLETIKALPQPSGNSGEFGECDLLENSCG